MSSIQAIFCSCHSPSVKAARIMNQLEQKIIKRADELYALRERSENVSESVAILEQGKANGSEYEVK